MAFGSASKFNRSALHFDEEHFQSKFTEFLENADNQCLESVMRYWDLRLIFSKSEIFMEALK